MNDVFTIGVEVSLDSPDDFLKIRETLQRMGVASYKDDEPTLIQSCHLLHKRGRYFVCMFKRLFALDGRPSTITEQDIQRENTVAFLLDQWGLCSIVSPGQVENRAPISSLKIVSHEERRQGKWKFVAKYRLGS